MRLLGNLISCLSGTRVLEECSTQRHCLAQRSPDAVWGPESSCTNVVDPNTAVDQEASQTGSSSTGLLSQGDLDIPVPARTALRPHSPHWGNLGHLKLVPYFHDLLLGIALENKEPWCGPNSAVWKGVWKGARCNIKFLRTSHLTPDLLHGIDVLCTQSHPFILQYYLARAVRILPDMQAEPAPQDGMNATSVRIPQDRTVEALSAGIESLLGSALYDTLGEEQDMLGTTDVMDAVFGRLRPNIGDYIIVLVAERCIMGNVRRAIQSQCFQASEHWSKQLGTRAVLCTVRETALALLHLHLLGAAHGNLRPSQVLLMESRADRRGFIAKIADAGLGPRHFMLPTLGAAEEAAFPYTAPELLLSAAMKPLSVAEMQAADVYSFGCLLYELLTSAPPYSSLSREQLLAAALGSSLEVRWGPGGDPGLQDLCCRCLDPNPAARPSFAAVLGRLNAVEAFLRSSRTALAGAAPDSNVVPSTAATCAVGGGCISSEPMFTASAGCWACAEGFAVRAVAATPRDPWHIRRRGTRENRMSGGREAGEERCDQQAAWHGSSACADPITVGSTEAMATQHRAQGCCQGACRRRRQQQQQLYGNAQWQPRPMQAMWGPEAPLRCCAQKDTGVFVSEAFSSAAPLDSCLDELGGDPRVAGMLAGPAGSAILDLDIL